MQNMNGEPDLSWVVTKIMRIKIRRLLHWETEIDERSAKHERHTLAIHHKKECWQC